MSGEKEASIEQKDDKKKKPKKFQALLDQWNGSEHKLDVKTNAKSDGRKKESTKHRLKSVIKESKDFDHNSNSFEISRSQKSPVVKNIIKMENERNIKNYKEKNLKQKRFKGKTPTRGMSTRTKPHNLKNIFGTNGDDEEGNNTNTSDLSDGFSSILIEKDSSDINMIRKALKNNLLFDEMTPTELDSFIHAFEPIEVPKGLDVVTQGYPGDFFYVVGKESTVAFHLNGVQVGEAEEGGCFGELALIYSCPRAATVIATASPTRLFRVGRKTFRSLLKEQAKRKEAEKINLLKAVDFLSEMSKFDLNRLARAMTLNVFQRGDLLVQKGDEGDAFYIVYEGQLQVKNISVGSTKFDDVTLEGGDYFGERALATHEPRAADVIAATDGSAFRIDRRTFERVLGEFSRVIMKSQDRKIMEGIEVLKQSDLTTKQFEELANLVVDKKFEVNHKIFTNQQHTNAALYLLREGTVRLTGKRSDLIKPGAYFGDDLLLLDTQQDVSTDKRAPTKIRPGYTAIAEENCACGILSLSDCRTIFDTTEMINPSSQGLGNDSSSLSAKKSMKEGIEKSVLHTETQKFLSRETTNQWLKKLSKNEVRSAVEANVKFEDLKKHDMLGEGQFGEVFLVSAQVSAEFGEQHFALKTQKKVDPSRGNSVAAIKREIDLLALMDHPYIVNLVHWYDHPDNIYILMGLVHGGELFDVIHTENDDGSWSSGLPECDAKFYAMVIADTLDYIHRKQFVYRDLKPENVLIDKEGYPIICDFGFAKFVADKTYTLCGTPNYLSPEVIMNRGHDASTDHWALGVLIYEMVAGENPFYYDGIPQMELFRCIVREKFYPLPDEVTDAAFYVVDGLLEKDPSERLGSLAGRGKDIMAKEWFSELELDDLRQKKFKAPYVPNSETLDRLLRKTLAISDSDEESFGSDADFSGSMSGHGDDDFKSSFESDNSS